MFGKLKSFAAKKLIEQQIKKLPPQQQAAALQQAEMIFALMEKNPKLFEQITKEIEAEVKKASRSARSTPKVRKRTSWHDGWSSSKAG